MLAAAGLPGFIAPGVYIGEVVVPIFIILGILTRSAALLLAANMIFTIHLAFRDKIFTLNSFGGWTIELNVFFLVTAVCIALLGSGKYAVRK
jgi:putative oxidoreductase